MDNQNKNLELDQYLKEIKESSKYKETGSKRIEDNSVSSELDDYLKTLKEVKKSSVDSKKSNNKEPHGIAYDFTKTLEHTIKDIGTSLSKSVSISLEDMTYSIYNSSKQDKGNNRYVSTANVSKETNKSNAEEKIKYSANETYIKKELNKAKNTDKELYKNLEAIERVTNRETEYLNNTYKEYNDLINSKHNKVNLTYEQKMSGMKIYGESKRNIEAEQANLVSVIKGETKEQQVLKNTEKSINYLNNAEEKIYSLKSKNKLFDFRGNIERNKIIRDINKEMEVQKQILKDNGINNKEDYNRLKNEVDRKENYVKGIIESENIRYKKELDERDMEEKLLKQVELQRPENKQHENLKSKGINLER